MRKIERELARLAEEFGFSAPVRTSNGHLSFTSRETARQVFFSSTPGDRKAIMRLKQKFRQANREQA